MIAAALDQVASQMDSGDEPTLYLPPSESYVGAEIYGEYITAMTDMRDWGAAPRVGYYRAVVVHKGLIEWLGTAAERLGDLWRHPLFEHKIIEEERYPFGGFVIRNWVPLSTYAGRHAHAVRGQPKTSPECPTCHVVLPVSGVCDYC